MVSAKKDNYEAGKEENKAGPNNLHSGLYTNKLHHPEGTDEHVEAEHAWEDFLYAEEGMMPLFSVWNVCHLFES